MLALSFLQPWLWLMLRGHKDTENRDQRPFAKAIGQRIALHASKGWDDDAVGLAGELVSPEVAVLCATARRGAIVGTAFLAGAVEIEGTDDRMDTLREVLVVGDLTDEQVRQVLTSKWTFGRWGLVFVERRELAEPVPCNGARGFWRVPPDVAERVRGQEVSCR
jgi:hypothetical protein